MALPDQKIIAAAQNLQQLLDAEVARNDALTKDNLRAEERVAEAERRAKAAEERVAEIQERLRILESLKTQQYQTVVTELFEGPSKRAARLTLIVALVSIIFGLLQTVWSNQYSGQSSQKVILESERRMQQGLSSVEKSNERIATDVLKTRYMGLDIDELEPNTSIAFSLPSGTQRYFRIVVPTDTSMLRVSLKTFAGDGDIFVRYDALPTPISPGEFRGSEWRSTRGGTADDECPVAYPRAGNWFVRVYTLKTASAQTQVQLSAALTLKRNKTSKEAKIH